ncbi:PREDICTED: butyrophilin-like protein 9 [Gavialis gangeticus]|uniref:butyrophilin-like protein 9 n=1 Tax=Gavialis gangeticus TaxID=94835 RepID=UPI00092EFE29|nr:PREDICTED: butyrophilin-like protein 9 [Gavialis gangeticus]
MVCRSAGWFPEPRVLWRDQSGQNLTPLSGTSSKGKDGLFEIENSIIIYEHSHQNLSCWIKNNLLNQVKELAVFISGESLDGGTVCDASGFIRLHSPDCLSPQDKM